MKFQMSTAQCSILTAPPDGKGYHHATYCITVPFINVIIHIIQIEKKENLKNPIYCYIDLW